MSQPNKSSIKYHTCNCASWVLQKGGLRDLKRQSVAMSVFAISALCNRNNLSTSSKQNPSFASPSQHPHLQTQGFSFQQQWSLSCPNISSGTGGWKQACFLFSFVAEIQLNGPPWRGWQISFCNSYPCETTPFSRASLFPETWQGWELNVFEQTGSLAQQKSGWFS